MGCGESKEKAVIVSSLSITKTPLPLHIYPNHVPSTSTASLKASPTASLKASPTASLKASPTASPTASLKASPTNKTNAATHLSRLTSIACFKFATFHTFPKHVQSEILHHIDKELEKQ